MNFNAPIPRAKQPGFREGSAMRSVRDSDANAKMWQKNRDIGKSLNAVAQATEQNGRQITKLLRRVVGGGGYVPTPPMFPFQIQPSPGGGTAGTTYYRVRSGTLNLLTCKNSDGDPAVTDYVKNPDDTTQYPAYSATCDFEVASGVITFFWIDNTVPTAPRIDADSTPPGGNTSWNTTTGWNDGNYVLVGWIDWTGATPWSRQIVRTDLFCIPG